MNEVQSRSFWLTTPFLVVALLVVSLAGIALWLRRHPAAGATAAVPLASSAGAVDALAAIAAEDPDAVAGASENARAARRRLTIASWHYAALRPESGPELRKAVDGLLDALAEDAGPAAVKDASRRLSALVAKRLSDERRALSIAASRVETARVGLLQQLGDATLLCAILGFAGGMLAAVIVRRRLVALREVHRQEEARTAELEQFATRVAHDLVSPLGPVTAGLHILSQRLRGDSRAQAVAKTVRRSVDKVAAIVDELLRFAWSGGRAAPGERADLAQVVESLRDELLPAARESGVALTLDTPRVQVACSEAAVAVVLQNLVRNAIKYAALAPLKMVRASALVLAGKVRLVVEDSGPGVPAGMEQAIFEPYVRANESDADGLGLGLATVKRIVESRAGRVGVSSSRRRGAMFWVELPLAR